MSRKRTLRGEHRRREPSGRGVAINEFVTQPSLEEVLRAIDRLPVDLDWTTMAPNVVPLFPRRRPMPTPADKPIQVLLPPGLMTGFGLDAGPAFMHIGEGLLASWEIGVPDLVARALDNVRQRTAGFGPRDLTVDSVGGTSIRALQTREGCASTLLLLPDVLVRIFGSDEQCFIAPMRDLLVSVAGTVDPGFVAWLNEEFAALDPNALSLEAFSLRDGALRLEPLAPRAALA